MKPTIIILCGKSASGKDTTAKRLTEAYQKMGVPVNNVISYTTRPPREGEVDGVDYHFIDVDTFVDMKYKNKFIESMEFRGWRYGTSFDSFKRDCINICVMDPKGIIDFSWYYAFTYHIEFFYLDVPLHIRLLRSIKREYKFKFEYLRRAFVDWMDFNNFMYTMHSLGCHHLKYNSKNENNFVNKIMNTDYLIYSANELKRTV